MNSPIEELLPFYVMESLTAEEKARVEAYLAENPTAVQEVAAMRAVVAALPYAAPPLKPSAATKTALMQRVKADGVPDEAAWPWPLNLWGARPQWLLAFDFVTLMALILVTLWALTLRGQVNEQSYVCTETIKTAQGQIEQLQQQLEILNRQQSHLVQEKQGLETQVQQLQQMVILLLEPQNQQIPLTGTTAAPLASGLLIIEPQSLTATLVVRDLPPLPTNHVYQFWLIKDKPMSAGFLNSHEPGLWLLELAHDPHLASFEAIGVSVEPTRLNTAPTKVVMLGQKS